MFFAKMSPRVDANFWSEFKVREEFAIRQMRVELCFVAAHLGMFGVRKN
jgi:hypothetical protein